MMQSRRGFLSACASTIALGTLGSTLSAASGLSVFTPSSKAFKDLLGHAFTTFGQEGADARMSLTLVQLDESCQVCEHLDQFILNFDRSAGAQLPSGLYTLHQAHTGSIDMYLERLNTYPYPDRYRAVFSLARHHA